MNRAFGAALVVLVVAGCSAPIAGRPIADTDSPTSATAVRPHSIDLEGRQRCLLNRTQWPEFAIEKEGDLVNRDRDPQGRQCFSHLRPDRADRPAAGLPRAGTDRERGHGALRPHRRRRRWSSAGRVRQHRPALGGEVPAQVCDGATAGRDRRHRTDPMTARRALSRLPITASPRQPVR